MKEELTKKQKDEIKQGVTELMNEISNAKQMYTPKYTKLGYDFLVCAGMQR